jgi:hypothetical protein
LRTTGVLITTESAQILRWGPGLIWRSRILASRPDGPHDPGQSPAREVSHASRDRDPRRTFFAEVIHVLSREDELLLLGDRDLVEELAAQIAADDLARGRVRRVEVRESGPLTDRQLVSRVRAFAGYPVRRRATAAPGSTGP